MGVLVAVAAVVASARMTPVWLVKKPRCPVVPRLVGFAVIV